MKLSSSVVLSALQVGLTTATCPLTHPFPFRDATSCCSSQYTAFTSEENRLTRSCPVENKDLSTTHGCCQGSFVPCNESPCYHHRDSKRRVGTIIINYGKGSQNKLHYAPSLLDPFREEELPDNSKLFGRPFYDQDEGEIYYFTNDPNFGTEAPFEYDWGHYLAGYKVGDDNHIPHGYYGAMFGEDSIWEWNIAAKHCDYQPSKFISTKYDMSYYCQVSTKPHKHWLQYNTDFKKTIEFFDDVSGTSEWVAAGKPSFWNHSKSTEYDRRHAHIYKSPLAYVKKDGKQVDTTGLVEKMYILNKVDQRNSHNPQALYHLYDPSQTEYSSRHTLLFIKDLMKLNPFDDTSSLTDLSRFFPHLSGRNFELDNARGRVVRLKSRQEFEDNQYITDMTVDDVKVGAAGIVYKVTWEVSKNDETEVHSEWLCMDGESITNSQWNVWFNCVDGLMAEYDRTEYEDFSISGDSVVDIDVTTSFIYKLASGKIITSRISTFGPNSINVAFVMSTDAAPMPEASVETPLSLNNYLAAVNGWIQTASQVNNYPRNLINDLDMTHVEYLDTFEKEDLPDDEDNEDGDESEEDASAGDEFCPAHTKWNSDQLICEIDPGFFTLEACNLDNKEMGMKYIRHGKINQLLDNDSPAGADENIEIAFNEMNITTIDKSDFGLTDLFKDYKEPSVRMFHDSDGKRMIYVYTEQFAASKIEDKIFLNKGVHLIMTCEYPLGEQTVSRKMDVSSKKLASALYGSPVNGAGVIPYSLNPVKSDKKFFMGSKTDFEITPLMPAQYYAKLVDCTAFDAEDAETFFQIYPSCPKYLDVKQNQTDATQGALSLSYRMFTFTDAFDKESQELMCTLDVQYEKQSDAMKVC